MRTLMNRIFRKMKTFQVVTFLISTFSLIRSMFQVGKFLRRMSVFQLASLGMFLFGVALAMFPETSFAANATVITGTGAPFASIYTLVSTWLTGPLVTTIALTAVIMGLGIGIARQSPIAALSGIAFAVIASVLPGVITGILGAVV